IPLWRPQTAGPPEHFVVFGRKIPRTPSHGSSDKECYGKYNLPLTLMKLMEELFTCPICKLSFGHKARLRKHIKKHTKSLEKNLAKANSTKKAEHEKMLIQERIARTGSAFKNESERNKYFERRRAENPIFDIDTPIRKASFIVNAGAFGLGKSRKN
ncbi:C2H2-type zinc finger protein, partial [Klebsiella pneumoniae]|uniref:C2H2-type zinc finger protein n=1 Tax=Klebsiella pneumoniae TaxID=573 RepID=UPI001D188008